MRFFISSGKLTVLQWICFVGLKISSFVIQGVPTLSAERNGFSGFGH